MRTVGGNFKICQILYTNKWIVISSSTANTPVVGLLRCNPVQVSRVASVAVMPYDSEMFNRAFIIQTRCKLRGFKFLSFYRLDYVPTEHRMTSSADQTVSPGLHFTAEEPRCKRRSMIEDAHIKCGEGGL